MNQAELEQLWHAAGHLFPSMLVEGWRFIASEAYPHPGYFSARLSCGHVIFAPQPVAGRMTDPKRCRVALGCYKCWSKTASASASSDSPKPEMAFICSFCGIPHGSEIPCMRPSGLHG
jgi:hypothetical protein